LQLVHALDAGAAAQLQQLLGVDTAFEATLVEHTREELKALAAELAALHHVEVEPTLMQGAVVGEISREAERTPADLVVIGARGTDFMRRLVFGSTAERLLRKTARPMLVVKQRAHEPYQRVLVALDFSAWSKPLIELAQRLAPRAHLVLLSAYDVPYQGRMRLAGATDAKIEVYRERARESAEQQLHALAALAGLAPTDWTPCLAHGDPSLAIGEQEVEQACDMIVVGKHGRNVMEDLLLGSVTSHVLAESAGDVLVSTSTTRV
jgi:nucleotide-binding universal stress UspA family protein